MYLMWLHSLKLKEQYTFKSISWQWPVEGLNFKLYLSCNCVWCHAWHHLVLATQKGSESLSHHKPEVRFVMSRPCELFVTNTHTQTHTQTDTHTQRHKDRNLMLYNSSHCNTGGVDLKQMDVSDGARWMRELQSVAVLSNRGRREAYSCTPLVSGKSQAVKGAAAWKWPDIWSPAPGQQK